MKLSKQASDLKSRWELLRIARDLLGKGSTVGRCNRVPVGLVNVQVSGEGSARFTGLHTCKSAWACPVCSTRKATARSKAIKRLFYEFRGYKHVMITYTVQHKKTDRLSDLIEVLYDSLRNARIGRYHQQFKEMAVGYVRSTEIMYGRSNGWHPHIHELVILRRGVKVSDFSEVMSRNYKMQVEKRGLMVNSHTVDTKRWDGKTDYITKSHDVSELVGWVNKKSFESMSWIGLLYDSVKNPRSGVRYLEYYFATKGRKVTVVSRSISDEYKKAVESVNSEMESDWETVQQIHMDDWKKMVAANVEHWILIDHIKI